MTHRKESELQRLERLYPSVGLGKSDLTRMHNLQSVKTQETVALASRLQRWAGNVSTAI